MPTTVPRSLFSARLAWLALPLFVALAVAFHWLADLFWFESLGYAGLFWRLLLIRIGLFAVVTAIVFLYAWINLRLLAQHLDLVGSGRIAMSGLMLRLPAPGSAASSRLVRVLEVVAPLLAAMIVAAGFTAGWDELVRFLWAQPFGEVDPLYGHDIGFYLFRLPLIDRVQNTVALLAFTATAALLAVYGNIGLLVWGPGGAIVAPRSVLHHLLANAALFSCAWAAGYVLDRYDLLSEPTGAVFGAGYTAVHVTRWALPGAAFLTAAFAAAGYRFALAGQGRRLAVLIGGFAAAMIALLVALPDSIQRFVVLPNELALEEPYLERDIRFTRKAFGLETVQPRAYDASVKLGRAEIEANRDTIGNIRLWDWQPLRQTFRQLQQIRSYYTFHDVDIDRYRLEGAYRQVLLAARELSPDLPGKGVTWVNRRLQYTHGYGLVMAPAAEKSPEGRPVFLIDDIPPVAPPSLAIEQPAIYFGEEEGGYRIVNSGVPEFDYPSGDRNVYTRYRGHGDVALDSWLKRLVYAWQQLDINILISDYIRSDSRIQLWRRVQARIGRLAPFLTLDHDPYLVVDSGRLFWIQDAYTTGERFPYAEPAESGISYVRNAVKIVVDAYEGDVTFYAMDPADPVLRVYAAAFPGVFRPLAAMPPGIAAHLRYPEDLFAIQARKYAVYHMTEPHVFYNSEDLWQIPREKEDDRYVPLQPYYVLIRLPGEPRLEFLLLTPLTPARRDNMIAWLAARSDPPHYGELVVFKLPKDRLVLGPTQIEAMIDQDTTISRQLSLWDQRGSRVIRGNLLVIPIDDAFLYVEPVYLRAEGNEIPQLQRIIASDGAKVAMEPTLEGAIEAVFGGAPREGEGAATGAPAAGLGRARAALEAAEEMLRRGDWAGFGAAMQRLRDLLGHPGPPGDGF
ncbi:UPF0182 family protein [Benzoatithermus flavus]|uniref:UPF0182 protein U1T56_03310 n=1 Tax=Benzoatithermus flavus TaxID=3108223 RepID=A0ABU8XLW6_9PROT